MKSFKPVQRLLFTGLILFGSWMFGRSIFAKEHPENVRLPNSCTLMAMPPAERAAHLARLEMLRRASSVVKMSSDGFFFYVNLAVMPFDDLERWAENEQKCCSFLKIAKQVEEDKKRARVQVVCPADLRNEVMQSFGLRVHV